MVRLAAPWVVAVGGGGGTGVFVGLDVGCATGVLVRLGVAEGNGVLRGRDVAVGGMGVAPRETDGK